MPTLEQRRASFALKCIRSDDVKPRQSDYLIELRKLPANLHTLGLGQTAAMLLADGDKKPHRVKIYGWLEQWLKQPPVSYPNRSLIDSITGIDDPAAEALQSKYPAASREARAVAVWLKKFAEAFLRGDEPKKEG